MPSSSQAATLERFDGSAGPRKLGPHDGKFVDLEAVGVRFLAWTEETGGGCSIVEHPIPPRTLVAPLHKHSREDEYSFVLEGRMGAQLGDDVVYADSGDFVFKPREQWHTFWNAGDGPCRILEIISPGGFEHLFDELAAAMAEPEVDPARLMEIGERYGVEEDPDSYRPPVRRARADVSRLRRLPLQARRMARPGLAPGIPRLSVVRCGGRGRLRASCTAAAFARPRIAG
jgi:mannose-6-phosphate isomerase-like protein (cupin superfamily)